MSEVEAPHRAPAWKAGVSLWVLFALVYLAWHGVDFDEAVVPAQILSGAIHYPAGHPNRIYYEAVPNVANLLGAGLWKLAPNATLLSGLRNFAQILGVTLVPFALATLWTSSALWGHFAAVLSVCGIARVLQGTYPIQVLPSYFSVGAIGLAAALSAAILLVTQRWRAAGLLFGALPLLHLTLGAFTWMWAALFLLASPLRPSKAELKVLLKWTSLTAIVCVAAWISQILLHPRTAPIAPYDNALDAASVYANFTRTTDAHRLTPKLLSMGYFVGPVAFLALAMTLVAASTREREPATATIRDTERVRWLVLLGVIALATVVASFLWLLAAGALPDWVQRAMPWRLSTFWSALVVPMTVAVFALGVARLGESQRLPALLLAVAWLALEVLALARHSVTARDLVLFSGWGLALATDAVAWRRSNPRRGAVSIAAFVVLGVALACIPDARLGLVGFASSFAAAWIVLLVWPRLVCGASDLAQRRISQLLAAALACIALLLIAVRSPANPDATDGDFGRRLRAWLAEHSTADEMLLTPQISTSGIAIAADRPLLINRETVWMMTYLPELAGVIGMMMRDLWGLDYTDDSLLDELSVDGRLRIRDFDIGERWSARSHEQWSRLGQKYGIRLVLAPSDAHIDLRLAVAGPESSLYVID